MNLNVYRNTHQFALNEAKIAYKALMKEQILALPIFEKIEAVFINYPKTKRIPDTNNVCSIHEKFFADALVEFGKLVDDHPRYWGRTIYNFGEVDKENPRVTILLREAKDIVRVIPSI